MELERNAAGHRDVQQRDRVGLADGPVLQPGIDHRRRDLRRELLRSQRPLLLLAFGAHAPRSTIRRCTRIATGSTGNGVYNYSSTSSFPTSTYNANNYWVDVLFQTTPPGQVTGVTATAGKLAATVSWTAPSGGGATSYKVTPFIGSTAQSPMTVTGNSAGHERHHHRAAAGHLLHVHGSSDQRPGDRSGLGTHRTRLRRPRRRHRMRLPG